MAKKVNPSGRKPIRHLAYGLGGAGKTSLLHLPSKGETWVTPDGKPGKLVYFASDPTSHNFHSFEQGMRERLIPYLLDGNPSETKGKDQRTGEEIVYMQTDWAKEIHRLCQVDWKKEDESVIGVAWDTVTYTAEKLLWESAATAAFSEKGPSQFQKGKGLGKEEGVAVPQEGDYRIAQANSWKALDWLISQNPEIHIFVNAHVCMNDKIKKLGPMTAGKKAPEYIPQMFDCAVYTEIEKGKTKLTFRSEDYVTNIKAPDSSLIPDKKYIEPMREAREAYWEWLVDVQNGVENGVGR